MTYKHTQRGYLIIFTLLIVAGLFAFLLWQSHFNKTILFGMVFILLILASFASLTVALDKKFLYIQFGYGIFKRQFLLSEIASVKAVKNHWYYGWGIRLWLWPKMWIYNISGFDAVEIILKNGSVYRIGTDESEKLEQAIRLAVQRLDIERVF